MDTRSGTTINRSANVYTVTFTRNLQDCVPVASAAEIGEVRADHVGTNSIDVTTLNSAGGAALSRFHLAVVC